MAPQDLPDALVQEALCNHGVPSNEDRISSATMTLICFFQVAWHPLHVHMQTRTMAVCCKAEVLSEQA